MPIDNNLIADREPQSGARANGLCGKKRVKEPISNVIGNVWPIVSNANADVVLGQ